MTDIPEPHKGYSHTTTIKERIEAVLSLPSRPEAAYWARLVIRHFGGGWYEEK